LSEVDERFIVDDCEIPGDQFSFNFVYNADEFGDDPPQSWADFFDLEKYPGDRGVWGSYAVNGMLEGALLADGVKPDELYPLDLDRAFEKLDTIKDSVVFYDTQAQNEQQLQSGEVALSNTPNASGYFLAEEGEPIEPVWNQAIVSWNAYIIPKGANVEVATALAERISTHEGQAEFSQSFPSSPTTKSDVEQPELLAQWSPGNYEDEVVYLDQEWWAENYDAVNQQWQEWVSG
jgi:putative spermidine/putrescine transport system substrate-binding protein